MLWLIGPLLLVVLLALAGWRKSAGAVLIIATVAGGWLYRHNAADETGALNPEWATLISVENVEVRRTFDATYEISGRLTNKSETHRIDGIRLQVSLRDCRAAASDAECRAIGDAEPDVAVTVLPGQTREFVGTMYYGKAQKPPQGVLAWEHQVVGVRARRQ